MDIELVQLIKELENLNNKLEEAYNACINATSRPQPTYTTSRPTYYNYKNKYIVKTSTRHPRYYYLPNQRRNLPPHLTKSRLERPEELKPVSHEYFYQNRTGVKENAKIYSSKVLRKELNGKINLSQEDNKAYKVVRKIPEIDYIDKVIESGLVNNIEIEEETLRDSDKNKAVIHYQGFIKLGNTNETYQIEYYHEKRNDVRKKIAVEWYLKGAKNDNTNSQFDPGALITGIIKVLKNSVKIGRKIIKRS
ncbi:7896_t:CDS:2 [Gigaspora margarita]|uniref:7896_t:CDS:1 n=1 Tax=Gigaspora margarita TaxID=4874 RepID=A0ABN7VTB8_GIGMA|nr:7896_t:CDS:2 [Gigaspora margarita]